MLATELIAEWIEELQRQVRRRVECLSAEELAWRPDLGGNPVGITVWHFGRWLDFMAVCALEGRPQDEQQWLTRGWATRTGYDPRGIGEFGYGTLTGYTIEEVNQVPALTAEELLTYLDQTAGALHEHVLALDPTKLKQLAAGSVSPEPDGSGRRTVETLTILQWLTGILTGSFRHTGEIEALNAMRTRIKAAAQSPGTPHGGTVSSAIHTKHPVMPSQ